MRMPKSIPQPLILSVPSIQFYKRVQLQEDSTHKDKGEKVVERVNKNDLQTYTRRVAQELVNCN